MHTIARYHGHSILTTIVFVVVNILWVFSIGEFVGPQFGGILELITHERPMLSLEKLECPFLLSHGGQGTVVATVKNPYDEVHQYTVRFDTATYQPSDYQESLTCTQLISVSPQQTAKVTCSVKHPQVETDSFMVIVDAYLEHNPSEQTTMLETLASSYEGLCIIQSGRLPLSPTQTRALLGSVGALLVLGWTIATWKYLETISRTIVLIVGPLAWALVLLMGAVVGAYLPLLSLLMMVISIALILWIINHHLGKSTTGIM